MPGDSGKPWLFSPETAPGHSGQWSPEYPALYPEYPGKAGKNLRFMAPLSCFVAHKCLYRFSWAQDLNQNPWTKSLLIVRRSYTQNSNIKSNSMSILWTPLFHFFFEESYIVTWFTYTNSPPAHTLNYTIKHTCVLSLTTKTHLGALITFNPPLFNDWWQPTCSSFHNHKTVNN